MKYVDATIVIPCYNHNELLLGALASIAQLRPLPKKVIVVDDGSDTPIELDDYPFPSSLTVIRQSNMGLAAARNTGLRSVSTHWVMFLDADDELYPGALGHLPSDKVVSNIDVFVSGYTLQRDGEKSDVFPQIGDPIAALLRGNPAPVHCYCFKVPKLQSIGFDETDELHGGHEDYDFICKLALRKSTFATIHTVSCKYIKRSGSMSSHIENMNKTRVKVWTRFFLQCPVQSDNQVMAALSFFKQYWRHIAQFVPEKMDAVTEHLRKCLQANASNSAEIKFMLADLPESLAACIWPADSQIQAPKPLHTLQHELLDWRVQEVVRGIALQRFHTMLRALEGKQEIRSLVLWGANDIAKMLLTISQRLIRVIVVDSARAGGQLMGSHILHPDEVEFTSDTVVLITAHRYYDDIYSHLLSNGVNKERVF
ncbi:glycosyltransferase family 2 protein [Alteromonas aestuariivivens]|uniref:glycosyltransferase family 2 protein n=1 Tax=Alteromonas aestuariivivens TaxID=1938339 RepID=UPI0015F26F07|nr:glycosyltransferase family A protein [Alteromonas aestuariivivens]